MMPLVRRHPGLAGALFLAVVLSIQLAWMPRPDGGYTGGAWFLYGRDTVFHDALVHLRIQQWLWEDPGRVVLWIPELHGGLPALGAWLWTPLSPAVWPLHWFDYPRAQWLGWWIAVYTGGVGAMVAARALRLRWPGAVAAGLIWMLCGHVVTLIHAGHFQKVAALGWLPWALAGAVALGAGAWRCRARGAVELAGGVGMMLLAGHPQVAYMALAMAACWGAWQLARPGVRRRWASHLAGYAVAAALGLALGGAQLLPGLEMAPHGNRADGVAYDEAVETSYPPGELAEFVVARVKGSSVAGDEYRGAWGSERIVSDYIGPLAVLLAVGGLALAGRRRRGAALFLAAMIVASLVVGLGSHTPVYRVLYHGLPGFGAFRSPGTFMAAASLGIALLAGMGLDAVAGRVRRRHGIAGAIALAGALMLAQTADMMRANRHFLLRHDWQVFAAWALEPRELDLWLSEGNRRLEYHDATSALGLRPMVHGARTWMGYHPITWGLKETRDRELGFDTLPWFRAHGVRYVGLPLGTATPEGMPVAATFPDSGRLVLEVSATHGHTRLAADGAPVAVQWLERGPNRLHARVELQSPATVEFNDAVAAGTRITHADRVLVVERPALSTKLDLPAGTSEVIWDHTPRAWRVGLFLTATALAMLGAAGAAALRRKVRPATTAR